MKCGCGFKFVKKSFLLQVVLPSATLMTSLDDDLKDGARKVQVAFYIITTTTTTLYQSLANFLNKSQFFIFGNARMR